jgi:RNA polymerase sigma-70 factor (ECF subfamily)
MTISPSTVQQAVVDAHRREWFAVLASTVRVARDLDLAEECVQEAYIAALDAWARDGVPARPGAWLTTVARRRALDVLRRRQTFQSKLHLLVEPEASEMTVPNDRLIHDDQLRLIFMCCHPALAPEAQVALTLRLVCGLSTPDVARAFLGKKRPWRRASPGPRRRSSRPASRSVCRRPPGCRNGWMQP